MLAETLPAFHRWFLAGSEAPASSILLQGHSDVSSRLAPGLCRYLNEFDEEGGDCWTTFAPDLVRMISETEAQRILLGLDDPCANCPVTTPCGRKKVLTALGRRGRVVMEGELAAEACLALDNVFRVSLGADAPTPLSHLVLRPELFNERSLVSIIGDTYLEWVATRKIAGPV